MKLRSRNADSDGEAGSSGSMVDAPNAPTGDMVEVLTEHLFNFGFVAPEDFHLFRSCTIRRKRCGDPEFYRVYHPRAGWGTRWSPAGAAAPATAVTV